MKNMKLSVVGLTLGSLMLLGLMLPVLATAQDDESTSAVSALLEEVVVTARKREESAQNVPLSVTAYGSQQLEALKIRDLQNLSVAMPNVAMDDIGTFRSTANFSIRGLGINSSIPSIDPTVGVFIDGVYIGQNIGVILDMFDIQSIEVLRGPQGTLFGRNVTGGAVLINTKRLATIYGSEHALKLSNTDPHGLTIRIRIPYTPKSGPETGMARSVANS